MSRRRPTWQKPRCSSRKAAWKTQGLALQAMDILAKQNAQAVAPVPFELRSAYKCREAPA